MLSPDKRQQIERDAAREIHRFHREVQPTTFAAIVDDIRHKVVEEGWFNRQVTGNIGDTKVSYDLVEERTVGVTEPTDFYGGPVTGWGVDDPGGHDPFGPTAHEARQDELRPPEIKGPEAGL